MTPTRIITVSTPGGKICHCHWKLHRLIYSLESIRLETNLRGNKIPFVVVIAALSSPSPHSFPRGRERMPPGIFSYLHWKDSILHQAAEQFPKALNLDDYMNRSMSTASHCKPRLPEILQQEGRTSFSYLQIIS